MSAPVNSSEAAGPIQRPSLGARAWPALRGRLDLLFLALVVVALPLLPRGAPGGSVGLGLSLGSTLALQAIGVVLVVRSNRIINFAQVQLGALSAAVFYEIVYHQELAVLVQQACGGCIAGVSTDFTYDQTVPGRVVLALARHHELVWAGANLVLALVIGLALAPLISWAVYMLLIRPLNRAPRLVATIVTIGVAQVLVGMVAWLPGIFNDVQPPSGSIFIGGPSFTWQPETFHLPDMLAFGVPLVAAAAIGAFLLFTGTGVAMLGSAENPARARTLGVEVDRLSSFSWMIAGGLSGVGAILGTLQSGTSPLLGAGSNGGSPTAALDVPTLVAILAAVVFARLESVSLALLASLALGVVSQVLYHNYSSNVPFEGIVLLPLMAVALLLQRSRQSRAETEATAAYLAAREVRPIPSELRRLPVVESTLRFGSIVLAIVVFGFPFFMSPGQVSLGSDVFIFAIVGLSLLILTGWAGQISLGQFAFAGVGGYVTAILAGQLGLFFLVSLLVAGLAGAALAFLVGIPALRLRGLYLAVLTLALTLGVSETLLDPNWLGRFLPASLSRPQVVGFSFEDERAFYYLCLAFLALAALAVWTARRSQSARALIASRDNEQASQSFGISLFRARSEAFAVSGFLAALGGGLYAFHQHGLSPSAFAADQSLAVFLNAVIGGLGSVAGPILGAAYSGGLNMITDPFFAALAALFGQGLGVLVVLLLFPGGISELVMKARDSWLTRVAIRHRILVPSLLGDKREGALEREAPIAPYVPRGGAPALVPRIYEIGNQWQGFEEPA